MAKIMTHLELLTNPIMGAPSKAVKLIAWKYYEKSEEEKNLDEEIRYLENYSGGSRLAYQRQGRNQG